MEEEPIVESNYRVDAKWKLLHELIILHLDHVAIHLIHAGFCLLLLHRDTFNFYFRLSQKIAFSIKYATPRAQIIFSRCVRCKLSISTFSKRRLSFATVFLKCNISSCAVERFSTEPTPLPNWGVPSLKWECLRWSRRKKVKQLTGGWSPSLGYSDASSGCSGCSSLYRLRTQGSSARSSASRLRSATPGRPTPLESDAPTGWWLGAVSTHEWNPDPWARCCSRAWSRVGRSWCLISLCFISKVEERYMVGLEFSLLIYVPMKMRMKFGLDARREKIACNNNNGIEWREIDGEMMKNHYFTERIIDSSLNARSCSKQA